MILFMEKEVKEWFVRGPGIQNGCHVSDPEKQLILDLLAELNRLPSSKGRYRYKVYSH